MQSPLGNDLSIYFVVPCQGESIMLAPHPLPAPGASSCAALCAVRLKVQCMTALSYAKFWDALGGKSKQLAPGEFAASNKSLFMV